MYYVRCGSMMIWWHSHTGCNKANICVKQLFEESLHPYIRLYCKYTLQSYIVAKSTLIKFSKEKKSLGDLFSSSLVKSVTALIDKLASEGLTEIVKLC